MNSIKYLAVFLILMTGCVKSYTVGGLYIRNESGRVLYVESTIKSNLTNNPLSFTLLEGTDDFPNNNDKEIARTKRHMGEQIAYLPISDYVFNEDAQVKIFTITETGEKNIVKTWKYSERNCSDRNFFNESCLSTEGSNFTALDGGYFISYKFVVLPEDLE